MPHYGSDLALIHDEGFGRLAEGAARALIAELHRLGTRHGTIVDVGCGSGITARRLCDAGYTVLGVDSSDALLDIARERAPRAVFRRGSFVDMDVPECVAASAVGEVLNYRFDERNGRGARCALFDRVFGSLAPGGVFLFDVAGPDRAPDRPTKSFVEGDGWTVLVETSTEAGELLRRIVTYRASGDLYRRDSELHRLQLVSPDEIESDLRGIGFEVERVERYDDTPLLDGMHAFIARKARRPS